MSTPCGRRSNLLLITLLLAISVLLEQYFIAPIFPQLGNLGAVRPMIVFLDIPLELPAIDILPVSLLFALFYQIAPSAGLVREHPSVSSGGRVWKALTGWWVLLILMLAGGGIFYWAQDYLPRTVSNGIDSFGVRADLTLPYPSGGLIHLHGSVVMLAFSALGVLILKRRSAYPAVEATPLTITQPQTAELLSASHVSSSGTLQMPREQAHTRYQPPVTHTPAPKPAPKAVPLATPAATAEASPPEKKYKPVTILPGNQKPVIITPEPKNKAAIQATITPEPGSKPVTVITPEPPPTCRLTTPPPIAVVMPRPAPGIGKMHPCFVIGGLKPAAKSCPDFR